MPPPTNASRIRRDYLILLALRWFPSGLIIPVLVLLPLQRGLSLGQLGVVMAIQGLTILCLEVPTGGAADTFGRRPVLLFASAVNICSLLLFAFASSVAAFAVYFLIQGVYRALDSGPLDAWFVDSTLARDPDTSIERGLGLGGTVMSIAIGAGSLLSGLLVAVQPIPGVPGIVTPVVIAIVVRVIELGFVTVLLREEPRNRPERSGRDRPSVRFGRTVASATRLMTRSRVLICLLAVEILWGFGMVSFETLTAVRLTAVTGDTEQIASLMGPLTAFAWIASAAGAALIIPVAERVGTPLAAALMRVLQGLAVAAMALFGGLAGIITAFLACYLVHGASNPLHNALLHRQVGTDERATVLSLNSMVSQPAAALGLVTLTALADAISLSAAMVIGAIILAVAAPLYLAARNDRRPVTPQTATTR
ncbi:MFS transporter [Micromonospora sp. WMMD754]|uniref:MFS transporter n=1 Tax=Micromonospora sp. WMMD754 TaxID=3404114 RepID=UPI003BF54FC6